MARPDPDSREARLAAQLRRNLRRRKETGAGDEADRSAEPGEPTPPEPRKES